MLARMIAVTALTLAATSPFITSTAAYAQSANTAGEPFYKGKTLAIYVGFVPGGGYDATARLVARYIGKYLPGEPNVIVKNMPGAGGITMANYVAVVAPKDGLSIAAPQRDNLFEPLTAETSAAKFDPVKLNWLGSTNSETDVCIASRKSGITKWQDLKQHELVVAGVTPGTASVIVPTVLRNILGLKFRVIAGYPGTAEMALAMQNGEVDGRVTNSWTSLKPNRKEWIDSGNFTILFQLGIKKHPDLPDVPLVTELAENDDQRKILELEFVGAQVGRPYFAADGVASDRVTLLRTAFNKSMADPDLRADAEKQSMDITPTTGVEMQEIMKRVYATPKTLVQRLAEASQAKGDVEMRPGSTAGESKPAP
jgi:tripartite-type tricarboxylate transporter receptor subunit TctC